MTLDQAKRLAVGAALEDSRWNRVNAAKQLGISYRGLRNLIKRYGLKPQRNLFGTRTLP